MLLKQLHTTNEGVLFTYALFGKKYVVSTDPIFILEVGMYKDPKMYAWLTHWAGPRSGDLNHLNHNQNGFFLGCTL